MDFALAIVKGLFERQDGTAYFGSLGGYRTHVGEAVARGFVTTDGREERLTDAGQQAYRDHGLGRLPRTGRACEWNWSGVARGSAGGPVTEGSLQSQNPAGKPAGDKEQP